MRGQRDLRLVVAAACLCAALALLLPVPVLRLLFAAPLALFLPGYAIVAAIFARRRLEPSRMLVLSVGLSLCVLALMPLVLDLLPGGISSGWWAAGLLVVVLAAALAAAAARPAGQRRPALLPRLRRPPAAATLLAGLGVLAGVAATVLIFIPLPASNAIGFTELWIEPLRVQPDPTVRVGVASREQEHAEYTLELRINGRPRPFKFKRISLDPGEEETLVASFPAARTAESRISATLFKVGELAPYRRVAAWTGGLP